MTSIGKNIQMQKEIWSGLKTILRHHGVMSYVADEKNETLFSGSHTAQPSLIRRCCLLAWCSFHLFPGICVVLEVGVSTH